MTSVEKCQSKRSESNLNETWKMSKKHLASQKETELISDRKDCSNEVIEWIWDSIWQQWTVLVPAA